MNEESPAGLNLWPGFRTAEISQRALSGLLKHVCGGKLHSRSSFLPSCTFISHKQRPQDSFNLLQNVINPNWCKGIRTFLVFMAFVELSQGQCFFRSERVQPAFTQHSVLLHHIHANMCLFQGLWIPSNFYLATSFRKYLKRFFKT